VTELELDVWNNESSTVTVTPHVWDGRQRVQHSWRPQNLSLDPGEQTVTISAPQPRAAIRDPAAQVYLADGQRRLVENFEAPSCATQS
jgi:hypothetical protein